MKKNNYFSIAFENGQFIFLDQTRLPKEELYITTDDYDRIAEAIERLEIRGAPAIGIAAAYGLALSLKSLSKSSQREDLKAEDSFTNAYNRLARTRPTAVNLFYALDEIKKVYEQNRNEEYIYDLLVDAAKKIHEEDIVKCTRIGKNGLEVFHRKSTILTHCNTGKLATGGDGTAFNVIKTGFENNLVNFVYADETRPLLQGSRLTAFELEKNGIPFAIQSDSSAAVLMAQGKIDFVVVGADRIALNGDSANKIGTYNLAVLCNYHKIPFYIAAPTTTIDKKTASGSEIKIEIRNKMELLSINNNAITSENYEAFTPAFDVTPAELITGIITEEKVHYYPYDFNEHKF
ncbi:MAG: S-methyl-5-thioribose-1-phosphate isomerase [Ignavibacteriaceae bacterium]